MDTPSSNVRVWVLSSLFHHEMGDLSVLSSLSERTRDGKPNVLMAPRKLSNAADAPLFVAADEQLNGWSIYSSVKDKSPAIG